jgi:hypothetical protein
VAGDFSWTRARPLDPVALHKQTLKAWRQFVSGLFELELTPRKSGGARMTPKKVTVYVGQTETIEIKAPFTLVPQEPKPPKAVTVVVQAPGEPAKEVTVYVPDVSGWRR